MRTLSQLIVLAASLQSGWGVKFSDLCSAPSTVPDMCRTPQLNIINKDSYVKGKHKDTRFDDFFDMKYRFAYLVVAECLSIFT